MHHLCLLFPYLHRYRRRLLLGLLAAALGASVSALAPLVLRLAVDRVANGTIVPLELLWFGGALIGLALIIDGVPEICPAHVDCGDVVSNRERSACRSV
ncbi:MAG: hypothetical protein KatS3mg056_0990 [Chloroflexus sp.]|nr:MAG: hypothetical protein KatS3mg056_0990 [Chloroflexus sp.]